jgi:hypothetical protein
MSLNNQFIIDKEIEKVSLTESYRSKTYAQKFIQHLDGFVDIALELTKGASILKTEELILTKDLYWELEGFILERIDDVSDETMDQLDGYEEKLRNKIKSELGKYYSSNQELSEVINYSVDGFMLANKFELMSCSHRFNNPWKASKSILSNDQMLHLFITDKDKLKDFKFKINKQRESDELVKTNIGIVGRGRREDFTHTFVKDLYGLRNLLLKTIEEYAGSSATPIKKHLLIDILRKQGLSEEDITDQFVYSYLIVPLKRSGKIGSCKEGYFYITDCNDLKTTYQSHFENLKGYFRTLEKYRKHAEQRSCSFDYNAHINFIRKYFNQE